MFQASCAEPPSKTELSRVHQKIREAFITPNPECNARLQYLNKKPGKMIRPLLFLLSYSLFANLEKEENLKSYSTVSSNLHLAAAVELIHMASLVHDDIIDDGTLRRGQPSLHLLTGKKKATLIGDFLMAQAFKLIIKHAPRKIPELMSRTTRNMCEGEAEQLERAFDFSLTENDYYRLNYKKTSCLLEACCEAGAIKTGISDKNLREALKLFGRNLGYAFQITDDIQDFTLETRDLGKPAGADLNQGIITLPLIYMVKRYGKRPLGQWVAGSDDKKKREKLTQLARESGALEYSREEVKRITREAGRSLQVFPPSSSRQQLFLLLFRLEKRVSR